MLLVTLPLAAAARDGTDPQLLVSSILLEVRGDPGVAKHPGRLLVEPIITTGSQTASQEIEVNAPGTASFEAAAHTTWRLTPQLDGFWGEPEIVFVSTPAESHQLDLWPTGTVRGTFRTPATPEPGRPLTVHFQPIPERGGADGAPAGRADCATAEDGKAWSCTVPHGRLDLRFHLPGHASEPRWDVAVPTGAELVLGELAPRPGASLAGFVALDGADPRQVPVEVELLPLTHRDAVAPDVRARLETWTDRADARGFYQFQDLAPGAYRLEARAAGFAPKGEQPVQVLEGRETRLPQPLLLEAPARLEVAVRPPVDPSGAPWRLELVPDASTFGADVTPRRGTTDPAGRTAWAGLTPGPARLVLRQGPESIWRSEEIEVERHMAPVEIELPLVHVSGLVHYDDQPVRVRLVFGSRRDGREVVAYSDSEGRFEVALPEEGRWPLSAQYRRKGAVHALDPVEIEAGDDRTAWLEVELLDTEIRGQVVDRQGKPVPELRIRAARADEPTQASQAETDDDGRFRLRALPPGPYRLSTLGGRHSAPPVDVELEDGDRETVRLVVDGSRQVEGRVVARDGRPVAGAVVHVQPETAEPRILPLGRTVTDATGRFEGAVPDSTRHLRLLVLPPGLNATAARLPLPEDGAVEIVADDFGGTVVLDLSGTEKTPSLSHDGVATILPLFESWARFHGQPAPPGGVWVLPAMAPGGYRLCNPGGACDEGHLLPGGELRLTLPTS